VPHDRLEVAKWEATAEVGCDQGSFWVYLTTGFTNPLVCHHFTIRIVVLGYSMVSPNHCQNKPWQSHLGEQYGTMPNLKSTKNSQFTIASRFITIQIAKLVDSQGHLSAQLSPSNVVGPCSW
jgi:hypothetical protein